MGVIEYKSKAGKIEPVKVDGYFPRCVCGGKFEVNDIFTKRNEHWGTSADCIECKEHFFQENYTELKTNIPLGQEARKQNLDI